MNVSARTALPLLLGAGLLGGCATSSIQPASQSALVPLHAVSAQGIGPEIGSIYIVNSSRGLVFDPNLRGIPPGPHGFHVHTAASCAPATVNGRPTAAGAAGGHFDPMHAGRHLGPTGNGHLGDLPALTANASGLVTEPVIAPRLRLIDLKGHALVIDAGGDTYTDQPPDGGGGAAIACGIAE